MKKGKKRAAYTVECPATPVLTPEFATRKRNDCETRERFEWKEPRCGQTNYVADELRRIFDDNAIEVTFARKFARTIKYSL